MAFNNTPSDLVIEDARLLFTNFAGLRRALTRMAVSASSRSLFL